MLCYQYKDFYDGVGGVGKYLVVDCFDVVVLNLEVFVQWLNIVFVVGVENGFVVILEDYVGKFGQCQYGLVIGLYYQFDVQMFVFVMVFEYLGQGVLVVKQ